MEEKYSIDDIAKMSGLSTRTLRNYIKKGILIGKKENGAWRFDTNELEQFIANPVVRPSIKTHANGIIYDFVATEKRKIQRCV